MMKLVIGFLLITFFASCHQDKLYQAYISDPINFKAIKFISVNNSRKNFLAIDSCNSVEKKGYITIVDDSISCSIFKNSTGLIDDSLITSYHFKKQFKMQANQNSIDSIFSIINTEVVIKYNSYRRKTKNQCDVRLAFGKPCRVKDNFLYNVTISSEYTNICTRIYFLLDKNGSFLGMDISAGME